MDNVVFITLVFWPAVVLLCAGLNMLISWTFSWSELVFDYAIGVIAGWLLFAGTQAEPNGAEIFFFIFSHGLLAILWSFAEPFRDAFSDPAAFFWTMAGIRVGCTIWAAAWDHLSDHLGCTLGWGPVLFSVLVVMPAKITFSLATSAVGFLIWLVGLFVAIFGGGNAGHAGGVFWTEFSPSGSYYATTVGWTVHCWRGSMPFKHELYHTRQYVYMGDWLIPFWCLGCVWGVITAAISSSHTVSTATAYGADPSSWHVGNPVEVAAYHL